MPDSLLVEREVDTVDRSLPAAEALGALPMSPDWASNMTIPPPPQP